MNQCACKVRGHGELVVARGERTAEGSRARERKREEHGRRKSNGRGRSRTEKEREKADTGIIIKRDISYVGGRIVSATRYARRFCVRAMRARAPTAPLIKDTRVRACVMCVCTRESAFNKREAPARCECAATELSRPYVNRSGPSAQGPSPAPRRESKREREVARWRREEGAARAAAGIKSNAATATAAINTHLFRSVLHTREAWAHELVR